MKGGKWGFREVHAEEENKFSNSVKSLYSTHCCSLFLRDYKITEPPILTEKKRKVTSDSKGIQNF